MTVCPNLEKLSQICDIFESKLWDMREYYDTITERQRVPTVLKYFRILLIWI